MSRSKRVVPDTLASSRRAVRSYKRVANVTVEKLERRALLSTSFPDFQQVRPVSEGISRSMTGDVMFAGDVYSYPVSLTTGQSLSVIAQPQPGQELGLSLADPLGSTAVTAAPMAAGTNEVIQSFIAPSDGSYLLVVSDLKGGGVTHLAATIDAAVSGQIAGVSDSTAPTAQNIDNGFLSLGATGERSTVVRTPDVRESDSFSAFDLSSAWSTGSQGSGGEAYRGVDSLGEPALALVPFKAGDDTVVEATWTVNLAQAATPVLNFYAEASANPVAFTSDFTGHAQAEGVCISADGVNWHPVVSLGADAKNHFSVNLATAAAEASMDLGSDFQIRFQMFDTSPPNNLGTSGSPTCRFSQLSITSSQDYYCFTANAGDTLDLAATPTSDPVSNIAPRVDLLDSSLNLISVGTAAASGQSEVSTVVAPSSGTYYARVDSGSAQEYLLSVAKNETTTPPAFTVTSATPALGATLSSPPAQITVIFSGAVDPNSFVAADLTVDGTPALSVSLIDLQTAVFTLADVSNGPHIWSLDNAPVSAGDVTAVAPFAGSFTVSPAGPRVLTSSIANGSTHVPGAITFSFTFDQPLMQIDGAAFALSPDTGGSIAPTNWSYGQTTSTFTASYASLPGNGYTMVLYSAHFRSLSGANLDGELSGTALPSGDGIAGGNLLLHFTVEQANAVAAPSNLRAYGVSANQIDLNWNDNSNHAAMGFDVERSTGGGAFAQIAVVGADVTTYSDTTGDPTGDYTYRVRAYVTAGHSGYSNSVQASTLPANLATPVKQLPSTSSALAADTNGPGPVVTVQGVGYFTVAAYYADHSDAELWRTDATTGGTFRIGAWHFGSITILDGSAGIMYFNVTDSSASTTLWQTDGTVAGTHPAPLGTIAPAPVSNTPQTQATIGAETYYPQSGGLWKTDGTPAGTVEVCPLASDISNLAACNGLLTFNAFRQLWVSDGTDAGTQKLTGVALGSLPTRPIYLSDVDGTLYFITTARVSTNTSLGTGSEELWKSDGTPGGTVLVSSLAALSVGNFNGQAVFGVPDTRVGLSLWITDTSAAGAHELAVTPLRQQNPPQLVPFGTVNGRLFFGVFSNMQLAFTLWETNGTPAGTFPVPNAPTGHLDQYGAANEVVICGNYLFYAQLGASPYGAIASSLWRTDGTAAGTTKIAGISDADHLLNANGTLYIGCNAFTSQNGLYKLLPGATAATLVSHVPNTTGIHNLAWANGKVFFTVVDTAYAVRLYTSDGTQAGTIALPGSYGYDSQLAAAGNRVFFVTIVSNVPQTVYALNTSDGTIAGTYLVRRIQGANNFVPDGIAAAGQFVFSDGVDLWRSNGTIAGTVQIDAINEDGLFTDVTVAGAQMLAVGNLVYYSVGQGDGSRELRVADMTPLSAPDQFVQSAVVAGASASVITRAAASTGGIHLAWRDHSTHESGFVIDRSLTSTFAVIQASFLAPAHATSYTDSTAVAGAKYYYRIRAINAGGSSSFAVSAPPAPTCSITGVVFNDQDGNGIRASTEPYLAAWTIILSVKKNGVVTQQATTTSDSAGAFHFNNLTPGLTYYVKETLKAGWRISSPSTTSFTFTPVANAVSTASFADTTTSLVKGNVFNDVKRTGVFTTGDIYLAGVRMQIQSLISGKWQTTAQTTTDSKGNFSFILKPGTYHLIEINPTGLKAFSPATGLYVLTLASGAIPGGKNFADR